jgi:hypothetical protein
MFDPVQGVKHRAIFSLRWPPADWRPKCPVSRTRQQAAGKICLIRLLDVSQSHSSRHGDVVEVV